MARFDRGEYWLAHEELEQLWLERRRDFYKGLIQIAAGFLHLQRRNWHGAARLLRTGLDYLAGAPSHHEGFDVDRLRLRIGEILRRVDDIVAGRRGERGDIGAAFSMRSVFDGAVEDARLDEVELPYRVRRYDDGYRPFRATKGPSEEA